MPSGAVIMLARKSSGDVDVMLGLDKKAKKAKTVEDEKELEESKEKIRKAARR